MNSQRGVRRRITTFPIRNSTRPARRRMSSIPDSTAGVCPDCGLELLQSVNTGGICPRCLIATAVEHLSTVDHPALGRFGEVGSAPNVDELNAQLPAYEFSELLGRGGAGWVFRALSAQSETPRGRENPAWPYQRNPRCIPALRP